MLAAADPAQKIVDPPLWLNQNTSSDPEEAGRFLGGQLASRLKISVGGTAPFILSSSSVNLGDLRIVTASISSCRVTGGPGELPSLVLPFRGGLRGWRGRRELRCEAGDRALLLPASCARTAECDSAFSGAVINFSPDRLEMAARAMLGLSADAAGDEGLAALGWLRNAMELPLRYGKFDFMAVFGELFGTISQLERVPNFLASSAIAECIYRAIFLLIAPERVIDSGPSLTLPSKKPYRLDRVCQFINENLTEPLTLNELKQISGLSARALQYGFQKAFGVSPMQWIIEQKLMAVRSILLRAEPGLTVTQAALPYFGNLGDFARRYRARFGELPSATLARAGFST